MTEPLERELAARMRASEDELDQATLQRLCQARQSARQTRAETGGATSALHFGKWETGLIAASVVAIAVLVSVTGQSPGDLNPEQVTALEAGPHQDPDLYENLEFYEWLAQQPRGSES